MEKTPLESWIARKIGVDGNGLTRRHIQDYQAHKLQQVLERARHASPFYRVLLRRFDSAPVTTLDDFARVPFTTAEDIRQQGLQFLCVSQSEISRVKTLESSGTTGPVKRMHFTPDDQELTVDFFHHGMSTLVEAGDRVLILLPGERDGSVGDLLGKALIRLGAEPVPHGVVRSLSGTIEVMEQTGVNSLVGIPIQALALARYADTVQGKQLRLKSALLSTDYVPQAVVRELRKLWSCDVFEHYGMSEMGLGGGVDCKAHAGYHLREGDLYFEIIDPETGEILPEGERGEIVVTTLTRRGMPLIRYRTGDFSRLLPDPCPCGTLLRRMAPVAARQGNRVILRGGKSFTLGDLDEAVFAVDRVVDYRAAVDSRSSTAMLELGVTVIGRTDAAMKKALYQAVATIDSIANEQRNGALNVSLSVFATPDPEAPQPMKRTIQELGKTYAIQNTLSHQARKNMAAQR